MKSNVNIANHPLHPIIVLLPAGAWITSFVLDIIFLASRNPFWFVASMWVIIVGIGGALIAAITGLYDLFTLPISDEPKRTGYWHMSLNLLIVALYVINVAALRVPALSSATRVAHMTGGIAAWSFVMNAAAVVLLVISGWLGGEMVYRYGLAVPRETIEQSRGYETGPGVRRTGYAGALGGESDSDTQE